MDAVEGARLDQRLDRRAVDRLERHPPAEVPQAAEPTALLARLEDGPHRLLSDALDRRQPEPDVPGAARLLLAGLEHDVEADAGAVDVGRADLDARTAARELHPPALVDVVDQLVRAVGGVGEDGRHVLDREPGLQVRRLVGEQGVAHGVGLVEAVARELLDQAEQPRRLVLREPLVPGAGNEALPGRVDRLPALLADRLDQRVRLAERHVAQLVDDLHDLFLVDHDAVSVGRVPVDDLVDLRGLLAAVLAVAVGGDQRHRSGAEEGVGGDQVFQPVGFHLQQQVAHALRLELERAGGVGAGEDLQHLRVGEVDAVEVERVLSLCGARNGRGDRLRRQGLAHELAAALDDRERRQAQEVHLEQAHLLDGGSVPLGHQHVLRALGAAGSERHQVLEGLGGDDQPGGVDAAVPGDSLELPGRVDRLADLLVALVQILQFLLAAQGLLDRHAEFGADQLRDAVDLGERELVDAPDVPDRGARLHRAERDDLGDVAVLLPDVLEDLGPAVLAQVDVDVGVLAAVRVGETLEQQAVADRAGVRKAERVADHRADARAARRGRDAALAGLVDEVPDDQEVGADPLAGEDGEFVVEAAAVGVLHAVAVAPGEAGLAQFAQRPVAVGVEGGQFLLVRLLGQRFHAVAGAEAVEPGVASRFGRRRAGRQGFGFRALDADQRRVVGGEVEFDVAAVGDAPRVAERLGRRRLVEELRHLLGALDVELLRVVEPVLRLLRLVRRDADQRVVAVPVLGGQEVRVVVADEGQVEVGGEAQDQVVDLVLLGGVVPLQFEVEAGLAVLVGGEGVPVPLRFPASPLVVLFGAGFDALAQVVGDGGAEVAVDGDQALAPAFERALVHPRLVVEALEVAVGGQLDQVAPALLVAGQQDQVESAVGDAVRLLVAAVRGLRLDVGRHVRLDAEDRLDVLLPAGLVEGDGAEQVAVVGQRYRVHAEPGDAVDQGAHPVAAVEQRVLRVEVEVDEVGRHARCECTRPAGACGTPLRRRDAG